MATKALQASTASVLKFDLKRRNDANFWAKVDKSAGPDACWNYTGSVKQNTRYGQHWSINPQTGKRTSRKAHRVAYELHHGVTLVPDQQVLHAECCGQNRACCNPAHLRIGTNAENMADRKNAGRYTGKTLTDRKARNLVKFHAAGRSVEKLAAQYGITIASVYHVIRGKTWSDATGIVFERRNPGRPKKGAEKLVKPKRALPMAIMEIVA